MQEVLMLMDDLDKEMHYTEVDKDDRQQVTEAMLQGHMSYGRTHEDAVLPAMQPSYPYLTNSQVQHIHMRLAYVLASCLLSMQPTLHPPHSKLLFTFQSNSSSLAHVEKNLNFH
jgi:hypothetical protein